MARFTQYPAASLTDYTDATTFLIANENGEIKQASLDGLLTNYGCDIRCASLTIASADVLQLNSTPLTIVAAQGAGTAIEVISASLKLDFNSVAYATNVDVVLKINGATYALASSTIDGTTSQHISFQKRVNANAGQTQMLENQPLTITEEVGDPTAGDSDITINVIYRIIAV